MSEETPQDQIPAWINEALAENKSEARFTVAADGPATRSNILPFAKEFALSFAHQYAKQDCPCGQDYAGPDAGDCTHFLSHVLRAGGLAIQGSRHMCPWQCITWAPDALAAFVDACGTFDNIRPVGPGVTRRGDFGFLRHGEVPWHAFVLGGPVHGNSAPVYSHSNYRDNEVVTADFQTAAFFRIDY